MSGCSHERLADLAKRAMMQNVDGTYNELVKANRH